MTKEVSYKPNTTTIENLPFPVVLYPGHYGAFFAFKKDANSEAHFCSCAYEAIENYIKIRKVSTFYQNTDPTKMYILDSLTFPRSIVEDLMSKRVSPEVVFKKLKFADKLCHECNLQTPSYRYCHEMYGGAFKQNYGWYANKQGFEWGYDRHNSKVLISDACPDELLNLIEDEDFKKAKKRIDEINNRTSHLEGIRGSLSDVEMQELRSLFTERTNLFKKSSKHYRKINNVIENEVRSKFGHKKVGEAWTSETILYYIVKKLFPNNIVHRHYRPGFLDGLELDIYIEGLNIGIEYQGIQHYKPVKHWGGEESFLRLKERDKRKKKICQTEKVPLIYFEHNEGLSDKLVSDRLSVIYNVKI